MHAISRKPRAAHVKNTEGRTRCLERPGAPSSYTRSFTRSDHFGLPFQKDRPVQNAMQVESIALCAITTILLTQGCGSRRYNTSSPPDLPRTRASAYRIARSRRSLPHFRTANRTVTRKPGWARVLWPCRSTSYFVWSQSQKIRTEPCRRRNAARPSTVSCNTGGLLLCCGRSSDSTVYYIRDFPASRILHSFRNDAYPRIRFFSSPYFSCDYRNMSDF